MLAMLRSGRAVVLARDGEPAAARAETRTAVEHTRGAFDAVVLAAVVADAAEIALLDGDPARAVTLLQAAESIRGAADRARPWLTDVDAAARAALGPQELAAAVEHGRKATIENILEYVPAP
jgi:hypothetical protein